MWQQPLTFPSGFRTSGDPGARLSGRDRVGTRGSYYNDKKENKKPQD